MIEMEKKWKRIEKEERKRNVIIKGLKVGEGNAKMEIEKILNGIGRMVTVKELRRIRTTREDWGEMWLVSLDSGEEKRKIMEGKRKLKGEKIWITEDLTFGERRRRWMMKNIARVEEGKGKKVWLGADRMQINGQ